MRSKKYSIFDLLNFYKNRFNSKLNPFNVLVYLYFKSEKRTVKINIIKALRLSLYHFRDQIRKVNVFKQNDLDEENYQIVFHVENYTHINQIRPLLSGLVKNDIKFIFLTGKDHLLELLSKEKLKVFYYEGQVNFRWIYQFLFFFAKALLIRAITKEEIKAKSIVIENLFKYHINKSQILSFLKNIHPDYVFVGNDLVSQNRIAALYCKEHYIPTGMIQHGIIYKSDTNKLHVVDEYFLFGESSLKILQDNECKDSQLIITGAPLLQEYIKGVKELELNRVEDKYTLIAISGYGHSTSYENYLGTLDAIKKLVLKFPNQKFISKLHPKDHKRYYYKLFDNHLPDNYQVIDNNDTGFSSMIYDWFQYCEVVITGGSTVAVEAMTFNIPVITLDPLGELQEIDFIKANCTIKTKDSDSLIFEYSRLLNSQKNYTEILERASDYSQTMFYQKKSAKEEILNSIQLTIDKSCKNKLVDV